MNRIKKSLVIGVSYTLLTVSCNIGHTLDTKHSKATHKVSVASVKDDKKPVSIGITAPGDLYSTQFRNGKIIWKLSAKSGNVAIIDNSQSGVLKNITCVFYKNGKPTANMRADQASADSKSYKVIAQGNVVVDLIPKGNHIRADKVTFFAKENHGVAEGNVVFTRKDSIIRTGQLYFDTLNDKISTKSGSGVSRPQR